MQPRDRLNMPASAPMMGGAAAARAQSGTGAVAAARSSSALMGAGNLATADAAAAERADELSRGSGRAVRRVGGRLFVQQGTVWTDAAHLASLRVYEVAPFSDAYFALVRALPELAPFMGIGDEVLVAGRSASFKVTVQGATTWRAGELEAAVRAFRGA